MIRRSSAPASFETLVLGWPPGGGSLGTAGIPIGREGAVSCQKQVCVGGVRRDKDFSVGLMEVLLNHLRKEEHGHAQAFFSGGSGPDGTRVGEMLKALDIVGLPWPTRVASEFWTCRMTSWLFLR